MLQLLQNLPIYCCIEPSCNKYFVSKGSSSCSEFNSEIFPFVQFHFNSDLQMLLFQRVILWPLLALIFFIIYYFDKIYLVKIHFYSRTLKPSLNKSHVKPRIQRGPQDCEATIQKTRGRCKTNQFSHLFGCPSISSSGSVIESVINWS